MCSSIFFLLIYFFDFLPTFFQYLYLFFVYFLFIRLQKWVTTDVHSLQYLKSKDLSSVLRSKFAKTNGLFFKPNLLKTFIFVDLKLYLRSNPLQPEL
jgi:hypothetical protein